MSATACGGIIQVELSDPVQFVQQPQTSQVLAADGQLLAALHAEQDRQDVALTDVADDMITAVIAIEDRRFFWHAGVDVAAVARAAVRNVEAGAIEEGGSTITQQYVKNTMTGPAQTMERKLREAALAFQLEQRYSKDEILERYLNTVYFGHGAYGVHAAAKRYFGIAPSALTLAQAATLAGLIASPSGFDPYTNPDRARTRRGLVLDALVDTGHATAEAADAARDLDFVLEPLEQAISFTAPYVVDEVKRLLQHDPDGRFAEALGPELDDRVSALFTGGLRITTTIDPARQAQAEQAVLDVLSESTDPSAALVSVDPATGGVVAMVGGRDYDDAEDPSAHFNLAVQGSRQPGSSFKPIALATALDRGMQLDREFPPGACVEFEEVEWTACNYNEIPYGDITLREATIKSANTVFARIAVEMGGTAILEQARTFGFRGDLLPVPSLALGAGEVSPLEMASAYGTFAMLGRKHDPHLISSISLADGTVLYEHTDRSFRVVDEAVAFLVTETLQEVVQRGTGVRAAIDRPLAGKTGTSQNNADAWFVGYTPDLATAVWVGFPEGQISMRPPNTREIVEGGRWPAEIFHAYAVQAYAGLPALDFTIPDVDLIEVTVDVTRNCLPNAHTPREIIGVREYLVGTAPTMTCTEPVGPPIANVPKLVGLPFDVASRLLTDEGFIVEERAIRSPVYPPGFITAQRPAAGGLTLASDDNAVVIWVSVVSKGRAVVPDVTGIDLDDAIATLEADLWVPTATSHCPVAGCGDLRPGTVWEQSPAAGTTEREFSVVTMSIVPPSR